MSALVSVLMATNSPTHLEQAVRSLMAQVFVKWELILIDDCAPVPIGGPWIDDARIRLLRNTTNLGLAGSLNRALECARGLYVARMDVDDICYPSRLQRQYEALEGASDLDVVGCQSMMFRGDGEPVGVLRAPTEHKEIVRLGFRGSFPMFHPTWMGRRAWFERFPYDATFKKAQDYELLLRSAGSSRFMNLPEVLLGYRYERGSLAKRLQSRRCVLRAQRKLLAGQKRWREYVLGASYSVAKTVADIVVEGLGVQGIRERAVLERISPKELQRWQEIWSAVSRQ